jgi:DNA-binding transcriptional LysR family regulator
MHIESLKIFCDVARLRSFSRGAELNRVLQSSASQAVHHLEEHLGVELIDRSRRPWKLTREGRTFYEGCREVVERYYGLAADVRRIHQEVSSVVRVAAIYSVGLGDMSQCIERFAARHPHLQVQVEYLHPDRVYETVLAGEADLGIVSFPRARRGLEVAAWRREPMLLAVHPRHRLARQRRAAVSQLNGEKFVAFERGLAIRREVDRFLKRQRVEVEVALEFDNIEAIKRAVEVGSGVSILPEPTLRREQQAGMLAAVAFSGRSFARLLGIIRRRGRPPHAGACGFMQLLRNGSDGATRGGRHR